jgi:hypothetical protein
MCKQQTGKAQQGWHNPQSGLPVGLCRPAAPPNVWATHPLRWTAKGWQNFARKPERETPRRLRGRRHRSETSENRGSRGDTEKPRAGPWAQEVVPCETGFSRVAADAPSAARPPTCQEGRARGTRAPPLDPFGEFDSVASSGCADQFPLGRAVRGNTGFSPGTFEQGVGRLGRLGLHRFGR